MMKNALIYPAEMNDVRIVGTLLTDSFTLQSGTKCLTVKTQESPIK